jgi:predicted Fe-Mo cluster-binding NifX family protein
MHFGHCEQFAVFEVDTAGRQILTTRQLTPPPHEPGVLPRWLHEQGVNLVIAGGMGRRAQDLFAGNGIEVVVGAPSESPESVVQTYIDGRLQPGENLCDH